MLMHAHELSEIDTTSSARRWKARLALGVERAGDRSIVSVRHSGPLRVQKALYPEGGSPAHAIIVHPPGGIAGGDSLDISLELARGAGLLATTPGATKWYRANGFRAEQRIAAEVAADASLEWLPQETIVYDGVDARNEMSVRLESGGAALGAEVLCFGRRLSGERYASGCFRQQLSIAIDGRLAWVDAFALAGGDPLMRSPAGLRGATVVALAWLAGVTLGEDDFEALRSELGGAPGLWGMTQPEPRITVLRGIADDSGTAMGTVRRWWTLVRPLALARPAVVPRIWAT
jgi:urease accessory protein